MIAIITGDIVNSTTTTPSSWLGKLKTVLKETGKSPAYWQVYRGDSFQLMLRNPAEALRMAMLIKAAIKTIPLLDVRMAIGLGEITHRASKITESNGSAFIYSGEKFELLKKEKQNLALRSAYPDFDQDMNVLLKLSLIAMDNWTPHSAEMVRAALSAPKITQEALGDLFGIRQSAVSRRLKRAYYDEIIALMKLYQIKLNRLK